MSENRTANADYIVGFLDKANSPDVLADPQSRKEFILGLDSEGFQSWLVRINGMARGLAPAERGIDGEDVEVLSLMPPEPEDKELLLNETLEAAQSILRDSQDTEQALKDASLLLSGSINYIHPFGDGNGRTSRIAGFLTAEGYDGSPESQERLRAVVGENGRSAFQNNPGQLTSWLNAAVIPKHKPENAERWPLRAKIDGFADDAIGQEALGHLSPESQSRAEKIMRDHDMGDVAATKIMIERDLLPAGVSFGDKNFAWVEPEDYFAKFTDEDIDAVMEESRAMRRERIQVFINAMVHPSDFAIRLTEKTDDVRFEDRVTTLHDYYADNVREYSTLYTERNPMQRRFDERRVGEAALKNT